MSTQGVDSNDGSSPLKALSSVQAAIKRSYAGDEILLLPGIYHEDIHSVRSGRIGAPIVLRGLGEVTLKGAGKRSIIDIEHSYIHVQDITLDGAYSSKGAFRNKLIYAEGRSDALLAGLRLVHLQLHNAGGECLRLRFVRASEVAFNNISNCGRLAFDLSRNRKNGEGIYLGTAPEQLSGDLDRSMANRIHHNYIHTNAAECIDVKEGAENNQIDNNICTGQLDPDSAGISARGNHNVIHHNLVYGNRGAGIRLGGDTATCGIHNDVYDNYLEANQEGGLKIMRMPQGRLCSNQIVQPDGWPEVRWGRGLEKIPLQECSK